MRLLTEIELDYDSVLIRPGRSTLTSRSDVILTRDFIFKNSSRTWNGIPIMSANMDTTGTFEVSQILKENKMFTCLHKYYELEDLFDYFFQEQKNTAYTMGIGDTDIHKWNALKSKLPKDKVKFVCIDVANGYTQRFIDFVKKFRDDNPFVTIIAGNVVTSEITEELVLAGADLVKVGLGSGSACSTRIQTGVGRPQLSAIIECADAAHGLGGHIIADGGCTKPGDVAKAFAGGADFVMLGGMFAGHTESGGETVVRDGEMYKAFYGMSSEKANNTYNGGLKGYKTSEGREVLIPFRGSLQDTVDNILGGLRSACTYVGAEKLKHISKRATFVRVSQTHNKFFE